MNYKNQIITTLIGTAIGVALCLVVIAVIEEPEDCLECPAGLARCEVGRDVVTLEIVAPAIDLSKSHSRFIDISPQTLCWAYCTQKHQSDCAEWRFAPDWETGVMLLGEIMVKCGAMWWRVKRPENKRLEEADENK